MTAKKTQFDSQTMYSRLQKKTGNENFPNVNLVLSICQLIVYLTILLVRSVHTMEKIVTMCQFYSDSSRFFCNQLYVY
jgi:hypothetical protein